MPRASGRTAGRRTAGRRTAGRRTAVDARAAGPTAAIALDLPDAWSRADEPDGGTFETYEAVNDSRFRGVHVPVRRGRRGAPADPADPATGFTSPRDSATPYAFTARDGEKSWHVVKALGDKLDWCGGVDLRER